MHCSKVGSLKLNALTQQTTAVNDLSQLSETLVDVMPSAGDSQIYSSGGGCAHYESCCQCEAGDSWEGEESHNGTRYLCEKNMNHDKFIHVDQFNTEHLPLEYRDKDITDMTLALSDLTVRLKISKMSPDRPEAFRLRHRCGCNGRNFPFCGSGWMKFVVKHTEQDGKNCECQECLTSLTPKRRWGRVYLKTVAHVVYDQTEATNTTWSLNIRGDGTNSNTELTLSGLKLHQSCHKTDMCWLAYVTHDMHVIDLIHKLTSRYEEIQKRVREKYIRKSNVENRLTIIVSHPHGRNKCITIGEYKEIKTVSQNGEDLTQYVYTTDTCPGSSGAPVFVLVRPDGWLFDHPHSRCIDGFNVSAVAT